LKYRINHLQFSNWHFVPLNSWDAEYGFIDYEGKKVMDIGADWGRTADYFLQKGAKSVIAVEGFPVFYEKLKENARFLPGMFPVFLVIRHPDDFVVLINRWSPDLMQVDCEGCEAHLFQVPDEIFSRIPEYLVEIHSIRLYEAMKRKCRANEYIIVEDRSGGKPNLRILYAVSLYAVNPQYNF